MGVPAFYKWLSRRYPRTIVDVVEDGTTREANKDFDTLGQTDISGYNPNGEYDNLYLDMNGIIHPCTHPEDGLAPPTIDSMLIQICKYVDVLVSIVRPRKLLFLAIDGVAPRAKMNQQRSRRFRAAKESSETAMVDAAMREMWVAAGMTVPLSSGQRFDSNVITPGTEFMDRVASALRHYIRLRLNTDPGWQGLRVILSDASVPGEGEHKIMDYIRRTRLQPDYEPNTRHVVYGLDADLIMLALATHEPHFTLLREVVVFTDAVRCKRCGELGHGSEQCSVSELEVRMVNVIDRKTFQLLQVATLREYMSHDLQMDLSFGWDLERIIDDFIFMCFFIGNDFLPHMPSLDVREDAMDQLFSTYRKLLPTLDGYLVDMSQINFKRAGILLAELGLGEEGSFQRRARQHQRFARNREQQERLFAVQAGIKYTAARGQSTSVGAAASGADAAAAVKVTSSHIRFDASVAAADVTSQTPATESAEKNTADSVGTAVTKTFSASATQQHQKQQQAAQAAQTHAAATITVGAGGRGRGGKMSAEAAKRAAVAQHAAEMQAAFLAAAGLGVSAAGGEAKRKRAASISSSSSSDSSALSNSSDSDSDSDSGSETNAAAESSTLERERAASVSDSSSSDSESVSDSDSDNDSDSSSDSSSDNDNAALEQSRISAVSLASDANTQNASDSDDDESLTERILLSGALDEVIKSETGAAVTVAAPIVAAAAAAPAAKNETLHIQITPRVAQKLGLTFAQAVKLEVDRRGMHVEDDRILLHEPGFKQRYYKHKFGFDYEAPEGQRQLRKVIESYVEGLSWVMRYYYEGCCSWSWFYPYHFAPFCSDVIAPETVDVKFELGTPFKPFEQLLAVLPSQSAHAVPLPYRWLMTDPASPIADFYPLEFKVDMHGARWAWMGISLLPFIDQDRLQAAAAQAEQKLSPVDARRNRRGVHLLHVYFTDAVASLMLREEPSLLTCAKHGLAGRLLPLDADGLPIATVPVTTETKEVISNTATATAAAALLDKKGPGAVSARAIALITSTVTKKEKPQRKEKIKFVGTATRAHIKGLQDIPQDNVLCAALEFADLPSGMTRPNLRLHPTVTLPPAVLYPRDIKMMKNSGHRPNGGGGGGSRWPQDNRPASYLLRTTAGGDRDRAFDDGFGVRKRGPGLQSRTPFIQSGRMDSHIEREIMSGEHKQRHKHNKHRQSQQQQREEAGHKGKRKQQHERAARPADVQAGGKRHQQQHGKHRRNKQQQQQQQDKSRDKHRDKRVHTAQTGGAGKSGHGGQQGRSGSGGGQQKKKNRADKPFQFLRR